MAKSFYQSILTWFAGAAIGFILTCLVFKIGWADKERVLILGYGGLASVAILYVKFSSQIKKREMEMINDVLKGKADSKDIEKVQCQIDMIHQTVELVAKSQEEEHTTIDKIYDLLLKSKNYAT
jgi:D-arabinose 1-dehydrogenase-like Zn-dependent alcohol dehydrogenase